MRKALPDWVLNAFVSFPCVVLTRDLSLGEHIYGSKVRVTVWVRDEKGFNLVETRTERNSLTNQVVLSS